MTGLLCPQSPKQQGRGQKDGVPWSALSWEGFSRHLNLSGRTALTGHSVPRATQVPATPEGTTASHSWLLNSLCHDRVYVGPHQPQVLINLCLQRARGDQVKEARARQRHPKCTPADRPTWYLSYTTGRVNIDTTAEEKRSTALCSADQIPPEERPTLVANTLSCHLVS